ncbi:eukaryotic translation initiation factor 5-like [Dysidea avara]|uniref:eukaryotic translation initiation factor 5-like n=1 Tax=Dysidea avara TaxID=196820 RepID=UPI0033168A13
MRHKLTTYIVNNPPGQPSTAGGGGGGKGKKRKNQRCNNSHTESPTSLHKDADDNTKSGSDDADEEEWSVDTSEDVVKARMEKMTDDISTLTMHSDLEKTSAERGIISAGGVSRLANDLSTVKAEAERLDMFDKATGILAELLFDKDIPSSCNHPELMAKVPHILKALYDSDLVEEEVFFEWHTKHYAKEEQIIAAEVATKMRSIATPVIEWLRSAEEESSSDEDEVEVVYSDKQKSSGSGIMVQEEAAKEENIDDIDIEAI